MDSQQQQNSGLPGQQQQPAQQPMPSQQTPPSPMSMPQQPQQFMFVPPPMVRHYPPRGQIPYAQGFVQPAMHAQVHGRGYPAGMVPIINMPPEFMGQIPRGYPVPGQQMMQPMPYPPPAAQQPHAAPVKRERKPLVIVDPRTNTEVELKPKAKPAPAATPTAAPVAAPSPGLGPVPVAPATGSNTPLQRPSAAEEMRSKALAAKSGASPSPTMATVTAKMETLRLDSTPTPQASAPQQPQRQAVPSQPAAAPAVKEQPTVHSAPPPLAVSVPAPSEPAAPALSAEEKLARAKREMEEKTQKMQAFEQKSKEIQATKEAKPQPTSVPPPLNAAAGFGDEPKPQISLPVPTTLPTPSPTNEGERLVYSRETLLGFRTVEAAMKAPADLHPDFQDYQPRPRQPRPNVRREGAGGPPRVGSGGPPSFGGWAGKGGGGAQAAAASQAPAVAPLKVSQNAWRRTAPTSEHEAALRTIRSILNRLAKDNFDVLSKEVLAMPITSLQMLQEIIEAIFDKALMEPPFGPVYAQLCKEISDKAGGEWDFVRAYEREGGWFWSSTVDVNQEGALNGPDPENPSVGYATEKEAMDAAKKQTGFKRILLNTCQAEFEKNSFAEVDEEERQLRESMDMNTDEAKQKLQHIDAKRRKIKKRVLGNMAFIGELFLKKMLSAKIINTCVVGLLGDEAVSNPEAFFDPDKKNEVPPEDIESLCKLFQTVGKEMDQGEYQKYIDRYFHFLSLLEQQMAKSSKPEQRTSRQRFMIKDLIDLRKARWVDKRETKVAGREEVRQRADQEAARSAQGGRGGSMAMGGRNQTTSARFQQGATTTSIPRVQQSSRFAQAATTTTRGPVVGSGAVRSTVPVIPSVAGRPAATPTPPPASSTPPVTKKTNGAESISQDKLKTSYVSALEEFVANGNAADLASEFRSLFERFDPVKAKQILVSTMVDRIIEKKEEERQALTNLLPALVAEHKVLSAKDVVDALKDSLEFLNDILIDAPKAAQHMAVLLNKCVEQNALTVGNVVDAMERLRESEDGPGKLVGELQKVMSADNMAKLNAALGGGGGAAESNGAAAGEGAWVEKFSGLVRGGKRDNELVEFLASCPQNEVVSKGPELFDVVFEHVARKASATQGPANEAQQESERQAVSSMKNTLKRLVQNGSDQVEHQVKALQVLNDLSRRNQHPQGFIKRMFENLYKNDIIVEDAFNSWRSKASKEDVEKAEGFFKYLAEAQPESNDDN